MRSGAAGTRVVRAAAWLLPRVPRLPSAPPGLLCGFCGLVPQSGGPQGRGVLRHDCGASQPSRERGGLLRLSGLSARLGSRRGSPTLNCSRQTHQKGPDP